MSIYTEYKKRGRQLNRRALPGTTTSSTSPITRAGFPTSCTEFTVPSSQVDYEDHTCSPRSRLPSSRASYTAGHVILWLF